MSGERVLHHFWLDSPTSCACCDNRWYTRAEYEDHVLYMMAMELDRQYAEADEYDKAHYEEPPEEWEDEIETLRKAALSRGQP